jgi:hypothetical protein
VLVFGADTRADQFTAQPIRGSIGQNLSDGVYAGTFTVTDNTTGQSFTAFCADLADNVPFTKMTFSGTVTFGVMPNAVYSNPAPGSKNKSVNIWASSPFPASGPGGVGNRLDYLLTQILSPAETHVLTNPQAAAIQGAVWQTIGNFVASANSSSNPANHVTDPLVADIDNLVAGNKVTGSSWAFLNSVTPFSSSKSYGDSTHEFMIVPPSNANGQPFAYQVLVGVTPEPSTMLVAGLGAVGFISYGIRRRKRA